MIETSSQQTSPDGTIEVEIKVEGVEDADRIITEEDLGKRFAIDLERYVLARFKPNAWETHFKMDEHTIFRAVNYQAKGEYVLRKDVVTAERVSEIFKDLVDKHTPTYKKIARKYTRDQEGVICVMDLFDLHIGMLAWGQETQGDDWDSYIGVQVAMEAIEDLIDRLQGMNITQIIFPVGNDLLHADNTVAGKGGMTTAGTPQDVDTRYLKMFRMALQLMIRIIERLRQIAPVKVVVVPGNHDRERAAFLGEALWAWFHNDPEVDVDNGANLRKYVVAGNTLLGFTHGDGEKTENLPQLMASERKKEWAETEFRVFHTGHFHRKRRMLTVTTDTYNGVEVLTLPSLVPPDAWHAMSGYVGGGRAAEAHLYGEVSGPCGYFRHSVFEKREG